MLPGDGYGHDQARRYFVGDRWRAPIQISLEIGVYTFVFRAHALGFGFAASTSAEHLGQLLHKLKGQPQVHHLEQFCCCISVQ